MEPAGRYIRYHMHSVRVYFGSPYTKGLDNYTTDVPFSVEYKPLNIAANIQWILTCNIQWILSWNYSCHNMPSQDFYAYGKWMSLSLQPRDTPMPHPPHGILRFYPPAMRSCYNKWIMGTCGKIYKQVWIPRVGWFTSSMHPSDRRSGSHVTL